MTDTDQRGSEQTIVREQEDRADRAGTGRQAEGRGAGARRVGGHAGAGAHGDRPGSSTRGRRRGFGRVLLLTTLGALLPGTAFLAAGRRRLGAAVLAGFLLLVAAVVWLAGTSGVRGALRYAVDSTALAWGIAAVAAIALAWLAVVVTGYRSLLPRRTSRGQQAVGAVLVGALCAGVALPAVLAVRTAAAQRDLIDTVFAEDRRSATVDEDPGGGAEDGGGNGGEGDGDAIPFGEDRRVNVLLLGGDGGEGRTGVRTDTVMVASIRTATGDTTLFSLPRNLQDVPFPPDTRLAEIWPDGFDIGSENASLLNAIYRNGPRWAPDALGPTDNPGADMLKLAVGEALGLRIDYYVLVNLEGFTRLVDALGGITVNINYYVPIGGEPTLGIRPDDYLVPGPDQHLDGARALDFARGRYGMSDYDRMARQRCAVQALVAAADPVTLLWQYRELAATAGNIVRTDIPRSVLGDLVDLGLLVEDADLRSVVFDDTVITPAYPDYDRIRRLVEEALAAQDAVPPDVGTAAGRQAGAGTPAPAGDAPAEATPAPDGEAAPGTDIEDACAYDPERAAAALAEGMPPTRA